MSMDDYYKINYVSLKGLGLWPYQDPKLARVLMIIISSVFLSAIFVQLAVFITHECTLDVILEVLSFTFPSLVMLFLYDIYYFNSDVMKEIMEHMYYDWNYFKCKAEVDIMNDHASLVKLLTEVFLFVVCFLLLIIIMVCALPPILDAISPLNESRSQHTYIAVEYFVDPIKYFYPIALHWILFLWLGMIAVLAVGMTLFSYGAHACALFKIANYRMEIVMEENMSYAPVSKMQHVIHERIVCAINVHRRAIQFCKLFMSSLERSLLFLIIIGVSSLSISLFRLLKAIKMLNEIIEICIPIVLIFVHFMYLFFGNYIGQQVTDSNAEIFSTVYNLPWYIAPLNIQKLLLFLLRKGNRNTYLSVGGIFDASYEGFTMLTKASLSYFTVILAVNR